MVNYYFQSYEDYFWQWEDNGEVISIRGGSTIVYRHHIEDIIISLSSSQGLPTFGALLLAMIATNFQTERNLRDVEDIILHKLDDFTYISPKHLKTESPKNSQEGITFENAFDFLETLSQIPQDYKQGEKRILIFQTIFQNCHNCLSLRDSKDIFEELTDDIVPNYYLDKPDPFSHRKLLKELSSLAKLARYFPTPESILEKAGLPKISEPIVELEEETLLEEEKDFIHELIDNHKTFHVGALVKQVWGSVHLPLNYHKPSQEPFGGVADITNRGSFDRLLLSEFAHDDLAFISRLANNEVLFFNREIPPTDSNYERYILLDVSLKNWGNTKTLLFAIATALNHHPKTNVSHKVFVLEESYKEVFLDDIHKIIDALQFLGTSTHSKQALETFFQENNLKDKEVVLLTSEEAYQNIEIQKLLNQPQNNIDYLIQADAKGNIQTFKYKNKSKKHLQDSQIPIEELWQKSKPKTKKEDKSKFIPTENKISFPDFPILLPKSNSFQRFCVAPDDAWFVITKEKDLLKRYDNNRSRGWELIAQNLPFSPTKTPKGTAVAIGVNQSQEYVLLIYNSGLKELVLLNLYTKDKQSLFFSEWDSKQPNFIFYHHNFYYVYGSQHWIINLDGKITRKESQSDMLTLERSEYVKKLAKAKLKFDAMTPVAIFKKINKVYINENSNLVFNNIHELNFNGQIPMFKVNGTSKAIYRANFNNKNSFEFEDGSKIIINHLGLLTFISSNSEIPTCFVISNLNISFIAATKYRRSGGDYYFKAFKSSSQQEKYTKYANHTDLKQEIVEHKDFYLEYLEPFIKHIQDNANPN